jgi:hypothetical protein
LARRAVAAAKTAESIAHPIQLMGNMVRRGRAHRRDTLVENMRFRKSPGLKAARRFAFFRGLKPPSPSTNGKTV